MAIKDIFLPLVSYPTPTTVAAIEKGVAIAGYLGADISATAVELEIPAPARPFTRAFVPEGVGLQHLPGIKQALLMFGGLVAQELVIDQSAVRRAAC